MNITRRDTIVIATIFNLFVFVIIIVSGKMSVSDAYLHSPKGSLTCSTHQIYRDLSSADKNISVKTQNSDSFDKTPDARQTLKFDQPLIIGNDSGLKSTDEVFSYDEIDQLLEEYALSQGLEDAFEDKQATLKSDSAKTTSSKRSDTERKDIVARNQQLAMKKAPEKIQSIASDIRKSTVGKKENSVKRHIASNSSIYIVQPGDNPWTIAKKCKISFERLLELNNLDEIKAKNLKIGQALRIKDDTSDDD